LDSWAVNDNEASVSVFGIAAHPEVCKGSQKGSGGANTTRFFNSDVRLKQKEQHHGQFLKFLFTLVAY
jgi:hypothetical protein